MYKSPFFPVFPMFLLTNVTFPPIIVYRFLNFDQAKKMFFSSLLVRLSIHVYPIHRRLLYMLHIKSLEEGLTLYKALASEIRIEIIKVLLKNDSMNMNELASHLNITNGALTGHIKKLEEAGVIAVVSESASHGNQKRCSVLLDKILIDLEQQPENDCTYSTSIKVGHYTDFQVSPTCGLASETALIGEIDDVRYFAHPDHYNADILWFGKGYVEYVIPNFIPFSQKIDQISISIELSSEAPTINPNWPSDISFYLNDTKIGTWTSPGDFGEVRGTVNPSWWLSTWNQYGLLKFLVINDQGTFIDGKQISEIGIHSFHLTSQSTLKFRLAVEEDAAHVGGLTIFGKTFGNYSQDIEVQITYSPLEES